VFSSHYRTITALIISLPGPLWNERLDHRHVEVRNGNSCFEIGSLEKIKCLELTQAIPMQVLGPLHRTSAHNSDNVNSNCPRIRSVRRYSSVTRSNISHLYFKVLYCGIGNGNRVLTSQKEASGRVYGKNTTLFYSRMSNVLLAATLFLHGSVCTNCKNPRLFIPVVRGCRSRCSN